MFAQNDFYDLTDFDPPGEKIQERKQIENTNQQPTPEKCVNTEDEPLEESRLNKWVKKPDKDLKKSFQDMSQKQFSEEIKQDQITQSCIQKQDLLIKEKPKINWGERRASIISAPNPSEVLSVTGETLKFDIQIKNKTKWAWKKGCSLKLLELG